MDYTEEILKVLSTELEHYSTGDGQACIDGVLTSAHKLNELFQQKLKQCSCYKLRELLVQKVKDVEEIIKGIDKEDGSLIDTWHNYQQGLKYALSLIDTVSP